MKRGEALLLAPLLAFAPAQFARAQVAGQEAPADICTTAGATLEDGESANGRTLLSRIEEVTAQIQGAGDEATRDSLFRGFLIPALSCTTADVDAAQVTLSRRTVDPKHPVDVDGLRETLLTFREVLAVQEAEQIPDETPPGFQEEIPALIPPPLFSHV